MSTSVLDRHPNIKRKLRRRGVLTDDELISKVMSLLRKDNMTVTSAAWKLNICRTSLISLMDELKI